MTFCSLRYALRESSYRAAGPMCGGGCARFPSPADRLGRISMALRKEKIIFLDVDGVVHPYSATSFFHAPCMTALRKIVEQTGASIVLSSSWQSVPTTCAQVNAALERNGLPICIDKTVETNARGISPTGAGEAARSSEIMRWVGAHPDLCAGGWVALDDMDLQAHLPAGRFVRTEAEGGLTDANATLAVSHLGGSDASLLPLPPPPAKPGFNIVVTRGEVQREMMRAAMAGV